jgi:hypothetical protein
VSSENEHKIVDLRAQIGANCDLSMSLDLY